MSSGSSGSVGPKGPESVPSTGKTPSKTDHKSDDTKSKVFKEALGEEKQASPEQTDRTYIRKPPLKEEEKSSSSSSSSSVGKEDSLPLLPDIGGIIASFAEDKNRAKEEITIFYESEPDVKRAFTRSQKEVAFSNAIRDAISQAAEGKEFVFPDEYKGVRGVYQLVYQILQLQKIF